MRLGTYQGMGDQVFAKTATQRKRDATSRLAYTPVGWTNAVVIAPRMAIQTAPEADPTRSTNLVNCAQSHEAGRLTSSSTDPVWEIEGTERRNEKDNVENEDNGKDVLNSETEESRDSVVGHERDTLSLLERLQSDGKQGSS
jgi:hypothetical protein